MQTYHSRDKVKARKVTDKDGESVVTASGPIQATKGSFVVYRESSTYNASTDSVDKATTVSVMEPDAFNAAYKSGGPGKGSGESTRTRKSAARKPRTSTRKATEAPSAADRVKGSQNGSSDS